MNHHEHDRDLIMALAEGSLDATAAAAARREVERCDECAGDLALQEAALTALRAVPAATLTDIEAARFKRDLDTALGHERSVVTPPAARRPRFNWIPVASVAAVLLALVLVAPSLQLLGGSSDDAGDAVALDAAEESTDTTAVAAEPLAPAAAQLQENDRASDGELVEDFDESGAGDDAGGEAPAESSTTALAVEGYDATIVELLDELVAELDPAGTEADARLAAALFGVTPPRAEELERCLEEGEAVFEPSPLRSFTLGEIEELEPPLWVTAHLVDEELRLVAHDPITCEIVGVSSPPTG